MRPYPLTIRGLSLLDGHNFLFFVKWIFEGTTGNYWNTSGFMDIFAYMVSRIFLNHKWSLQNIWLFANGSQNSWMVSNSANSRPKLIVWYFVRGCKHFKPPFHNLLLKFHSPTLYCIWFYPQWTNDNFVTINTQFYLSWESWFCCVFRHPLPPVWCTPSFTKSLLCLALYFIYSWLFSYLKFFINKKCTIPEDKYSISQKSSFNIIL